MKSLRALDLFCGAGGASEGLRRAGFEVTGVDIRPQPSYRAGRFIEVDAMFALTELERACRGAVSSFVDDLGAPDMIWASPPCQRYSKATKRWAGRFEEHPDLVNPVRVALEKIEVPWVIENVVGAPLRRDLMLCGTMFDLRVFRHRIFEASFALTQPDHPRHDGSTGAHRGYSTLWSGRNGFICVAGHNFEKKAAEDAMGIDWMRSRAELAEAVPPAYAEHIGRCAMAALRPTSWPSPGPAPSATD